MKNIIIIVFCLFTVTTFSQQKKTTNTKAKKTITVKKKQVSNSNEKIKFVKCDMCNGKRLCNSCNGDGLEICWKHNGYDNCNDEPEYFEDEGDICAKGCDICGGYEKRNALCHMCNGNKRCTKCYGFGTIEKEEL